MSDETVKDMASLLKNGATMLDKYCPQCSSILFKLRDASIYCPNCKKEVVIIKEEKNNNNYNSSSQFKEKSKKNNRSISENIEDVFLKKLELLCNQMSNTDDLIIIEKLLPPINRIIDILIKIKNI